MAKRKQSAVVEALMSESQLESEITPDEIARRAYALYLARGSADGYDLDDWLQAERDLRNEKLAA